MSRMLSRPVWLLILLLLFPHLAVSGSGSLTLAAVVEKAATSDPEVVALIWRTRRGEARMDEISHRDGWEAFVESDQGLASGDRLEERDESRDRSYRWDKDELTDEQWQLTLGLRRSFLGPGEERAADIALERLDQLDRLEDILRARLSAALDAVEAYLDVVDAARLTAMIEDQITYAEKIAHSLQARAAQGEALLADVLETEHDLAQLRQKALRVENQAERRLGYLARLMERPVLTAADLAPPVAPGASQLSAASLDELISEALAVRPDLRAATVALAAASAFAAQHARVLPELDVELGLGYEIRDRIWADERREEGLWDINLSFELAIPVAIRQRNAARKTRFRAEAEARRAKLEARREQIERTVRRAYESFHLAEAEVAVQDARLAHARESFRVTELTAQRLPELLGQSPMIAVYRARARVLEAESDRQRAEHDRLSALLSLAAVTNRLLSDTFEGLTPSSLERQAP